MKGFTIIELLVVIAILAVIAVIAVPAYSGYLDATNVTIVQNNLRAIYLQQQDYFVNNNGYYSTGSTCADSATAINTNLFSGTKVLDNSNGFTYCVTQATSGDFLAQGDEISGSRVFTINELNVNNF